LAELQRDRITRGDFLAFGVLGTITGALLTIPPAAFVLGPMIDTTILGQSDVEEVWVPVAPIDEVPEGEPAYFRVDFPLNQTYGVRELQEESGVTDKRFDLTAAVWLSWRDGQRPQDLGDVSGGVSPEQAQLALDNLNVLSNSCAHLGCPVRWVVIEGEGEFLCPCHGGIYDINGGYYAGPPPRGMYEYAHREIREDGVLYIQHGYITGGELGPQEPYVV
jgi:Rieske Fe-S protein